jgi:hypothetical protein
MVVKDKLCQIGVELKHHSPFTMFGAAMGIVFMLLFKNTGAETANKLFQFFHPLHVVLSAMVTVALFMNHSKLRNFFVLLIIGWAGSIGIATLSDSILPYYGESILGVVIPTHMDVFHHGHGHTHGAGEKHIHENADEEHTHEHANDGHIHEHADEEHMQENNHQGDIHNNTGDELAAEPRMHIGFIEHWYIVNPAALIGVLLAYFWTKSTFPHAGHVLISTWASSSHILMNLHGDITMVALAGIFIVLFLAVWLPCCVSDIVFPMLFIKSGHPYSCGCDTKKKQENETE